MEEQTVSHFLGSFLEQQTEGETVLFEVVGGYITHILDTLERHKRIFCVSLHSEQGCAFAADGWSRMTGLVGICAGTSGPGATNLLTGIGHSFFDGGAVLAITGAVNLHEMRKTAAVRQMGFQELDIVAMARPITKMAAFVGKAEDFPQILTECYQQATSGWKGPVLIDIPIGMQLKKVTAPVVPPAAPLPIMHENLDREVVHALETLMQAKRPLILVGGGLAQAKAINEFQGLIERLHIPVVFSLLATDCLPSSSPWRIGFIGSYGNRWANIFTMQCDVLLVLGSRLDMRQTGAITQVFEKRKIIQVDCEPAQINNRVKGCHPIVADLKEFVLKMAGLNIVAKDTKEWVESAYELRKKYPDEAEVCNPEGINVARFMHELGDANITHKVKAVTVDVGNHQMWTAQSLRVGKNQRVLTSGGMGAMGCALPLAIGAAFAQPKDAPVVSIAGDGGFQMNIQELQSVVHHNLPVKMVVLNNKCYGMVRQFQTMYLGGRTRSTVEGYSAPSFSRVAMAYGIAASAVEKPEDVKEHLRMMFEDPLKPYLLEVILPLDTDALPKIAFGNSMDVMDPEVPGTRIAPRAFTTPE